MKNQIGSTLRVLSFPLLIAGCVPGTPAAKLPDLLNGSTNGGSEPTIGIGNHLPILPVDPGTGVPVNVPQDPGSSGEGGSYNPPGSGTGGDGGAYIPERLLFCGEQGQIVLQKGQSTLLQWQYPNGYVPPTGLSLTLESDPAGIANIGTITPVSVLSATYTAPASIPQEFTVSVRAALQDSTSASVCRVRLVKDGGLGVEDDGTTRGAVGNVYPLPVNQPRLPDFSQMTPVSTVLVPNFDVPQRAFSLGFPGVEDLFEWFGIRFEGRITVPTTGMYGLRITSDDGSILWIDGTKVIDNDGVHAPVTVTVNKQLTAGNHAFRLDYFQGPRNLIALELFWKKPGDAGFTIVPPDALLRPAP